jgi:hypothetical protein
MAAGLRIIAASEPLLRNRVPSFKWRCVKSEAINSRSTEVLYDLVTSSSAL